MPLRHGSWDDRSDWIGPHVYSHTNMTEIKDALQLLWRNNVPADKVNLGLAFYGRSYTLSDAHCATPGCEFKGPGKAGECTVSRSVASWPRCVLSLTSSYPHAGHCRISFIYRGQGPTQKDQGKTGP